MMSSRSILPSVVTGSCCVRPKSQQPLPDSAGAERLSLTAFDRLQQISFDGMPSRGNQSSGALSARPTLVGRRQFHELSRSKNGGYTLPPHPRYRLVRHPSFWPGIGNERKGGG